MFFRKKDDSQNVSGVFSFMDVLNAFEKRVRSEVEARFIEFDEKISDLVGGMKDLRKKQDMMKNDFVKMYLLAQEAVVKANSDSGLIQKLIEIQTILNRYQIKDMTYVNDNTSSDASKAGDQMAIPMDSAPCQSTSEVNQ